MAEAAMNYFMTKEYLKLDPELKKLPPRHRKFRANRSMRDVEASVNLWVRTLDDLDVEEDEA